MVFSIFVILFIGIIAFFHYVQGFFSATISAMITVLAAVLAVSYNETVVNLLLKGKLADEAHGMMLCIIFAVVYIVLRVIFDAAIPGNVRTPSTVDKVGAGLMGIVAGIFCTGIFAIAVQMLPWDPTISFMGYDRYATDEKKPVYVHLGNNGQEKDSSIYSELQGNSLTADRDNAAVIPAAKKGLLVPVDDMVIGLVDHLSDGGSLAGDKPLASVHPDYLQELFGERLGIQTGAQRVTLNLNGNQNIDIDGVFMVAHLPCADGQVKDLRPPTYKPTYTNEVKPGPDQRILVVRVKVKAGATSDTDSYFRFSPGSVHLVGKGFDGKYRDFYPIGMLENGSTVLLDKPDDFLFCKQDGGFDAVFVVDKELVSGDQKDVKISPNVSISVKRFSELDLSDTPVSQSLTYDPTIEVLRSKFLLDQLKTKLQEKAPMASASPAPSSGTPAAGSHGQPEGGARGGGTAVFDGGESDIPSGWARVEPLDHTVSMELLLAGTDPHAADRGITLRRLSPQGPTAQAAAATLKYPGVELLPDAVDVNGVAGVMFKTTSKDMKSPQIGMVVFHGGFEYLLGAVAKPGIDISAEFRHVVDSWKWTGQ